MSELLSLHGNEHNLRINHFKRIKAVSRLLMSLPEANANQAACVHTSPIPDKSVDELCLFVTFAPDPCLKQHVIDHANALIDRGIDVILIVNTDHKSSHFTIPETLQHRLFGLMIRQNLGFDFAAWAHAYCLTGRNTIRQRLYLVNDSIVGPLDNTAYDLMLNKIRSSAADMVGLTANTIPCWHLQSYFLVFNQRLISSKHLDTFLRNVLNLPTKQDVIDHYETELTAFLIDNGYSCQPVYPHLATGDHNSNDTIYSWAGLIEHGFPFVKTAVLRELHNTKDAIRLIPERYRHTNV